MPRFARSIQIEVSPAEVWALRLTGGHVLTPDRDTTRAEFSLEAGGGLGRLLEPVMRRMVFSRKTRNATEGLKRHVEGHAAR